MQFSSQNRGNTDARNIIPVVFFSGLSFVISIIVARLAVNFYGSIGILHLGYALNGLSMAYLWGSLSSESGLIRRFIIHVTDKENGFLLTFFILTPIIGALGFFITASITSSNSLLSSKVLYIIWLLLIVCAPHIAYIKSSLISNGSAGLKTFLEFCLSISVLASFLFIKSAQQILFFIPMISALITLAVIVFYTKFHENYLHQTFVKTIKKNDFLTCLSQYRFSLHSLNSGILYILTLLTLRDFLIDTIGSDSAAVLESHFRSLIWFVALTTVISANIIFPFIIRTVSNAPQKVLKSLFPVVLLSFFGFLFFGTILGGLIFFLAFGDTIKFSLYYLFLFSLYESLKFSGSIFSATLLGLNRVSITIISEIILYTPFLIFCVVHSFDLLKLSSPVSIALNLMIGSAFVYLLFLIICSFFALQKK